MGLANLTFRGGDLLKFTYKIISKKEAKYNKKSRPLTIKTLLFLVYQNKMKHFMFFIIFVSLNVKLVDALELNRVGVIKDCAIHITSKKGNKPISFGTGFVVIYSTKNADEIYKFIVTAKHVIQNADGIEIKFNRNLNIPDQEAGKPSVVASSVPLKIDNQYLWQEAPDNVDIAVIFFGIETKDTISQSIKKADEYVKANQQSVEEQVWLNIIQLPLQEVINDKSPDEILSDVYYAGYPLGIYSNKWLRPFTRRSTIALKSAQGLSIPEINQSEIFIDCSPVEGESGSPVFVHETEFLEGNGGLVYKSSSYLLGVLLGKVTYNNISKSIAKTKDVEITTELKTKSDIGLGRVAPSKYIIYAIENFIKRVSH